MSSALSTRDGELVLADLTAPLRVLTFPLLETIVITAVFWAGIGWISRPDIAAALSYNADPLRLALLGFWVLGVIWRLALPLWRARRRRVLLTSTRIVDRPGTFRGATQDVDLSFVYGARKVRGGRVALAVAGLPEPMTISNVPRPKKLAQLISGQRRSGSHRGRR